MSNVAAFVRRLDGMGHGAVYRLDPPLVSKDYDGEVTGEHEYVWVSAVSAPYSGPETYIFACDESGDVTDWGELPGSYRGGLDHAEALHRAGYEVS